MGPSSTWDPERWLTASDRARSATSTHLDDLRRALEPVGNASVDAMLDIGCGYGGLSRTVGEYVGAKTIHGVDVDPGVAQEVAGKGVEFALADVGAGGLPFQSSKFDFLMSLGMLDYLPTFDGAMIEMHRLLSPGGMVLIALPNLASWHNRLALMLGYQPRDIEISKERLTGLMPWYRDEPPTGHIHTATPRAFVALMEHHGFKLLRLTAGRPGGRAKPKVLEAVDALLSRRITLARRCFYLMRKS
jgi:SAM-dependent methyltransferase